jgi:DNA-binding transcriptional LysR family regulator
MRRNSFADLNAFIAVAEHRNFTKAASSLGISPSTLSQTIRALEDQFGVRLLNRTTRSVALTEAGERLLVRLRPVLSDFDAAIDSVNAFRNRPGGKLRLTMSAMASAIMSPILARFMAAHPEIHIELVASTRLIDIVAERFDAGIRIGRRLERDMIAARASPDIRYVVVATPAYLKSHARPHVPADLLEHNCIRFRYTSGAFLPWAFNVEGKTIAVDVGGSFLVNDPDSAVCAALAGIGIFYGPLDCVQPSLDDGSLVPLLDDFLPEPADGFFLYYPSRRQNSAALQALIDFLHRSFARRNGGEIAAKPVAPADQEQLKTIARGSIAAHL